MLFRMLLCSESCPQMESAFFVFGRMSLDVFSGALAFGESSLDPTCSWFFGDVLLVGEHRGALAAAPSMAAPEPREDPPRRADVLEAWRAGKEQRVRSLALTATRQICDGSNHDANEAVFKIQCAKAQLAAALPIPD